MKILVLGGAGYIGSHTIVSLLKENHEVICVDNLYNSKKVCIDRIKEISNKDFKFYEVDACDYERLKTVFIENKGIDAVIVLAGYKAVGESVDKPLMYYDNNLNIIFNTLRIMKEEKVYNIIFSSSATVYGKPNKLPIKEDFPLSTTNPYGSTKLMIENILKDLYKSDNSFDITILRYFNPIGAHKSGLLGEDPNGIPNNLMPYILKVSIKELECLTIFGNDYNTPDGTCIRDYIHVVDLAKGHLKALEHSINNNPNLYVYNLGSGKGVSVQEIVDAFEDINNLKLNYKYGDRRAGDLPEYFADATKALKELNWKTEKTIEDMCRDSYNFITKKK